MNCFYHPQTVAVGLCKSCGKGLCPACAVDMDQGLACRGRCEQEVRDLIELVSGSVKRRAANEHLLKTARGNRYFYAGYYFCFGLLLLGYVAYRDFSSRELIQPDYLFLAMGIFFCIFGTIAFFRVRPFPKTKS
jgi:hypothetical protein